jgi:xanthine dehydrogenase YagR molybdenum-binding subunit
VADDNRDAQERIPEPWGESSTLKVVGKTMVRRSAFDKVTGRALYTFDVYLPGMLYGVIVRSQIKRGRVVSIDQQKAAQIPGVRLILTPENSPKYAGQTLAAVPDFKGRPAISDVIRFLGEEIGAVAADTEQAAEEAARLLEIKYETYPAVIEPEEAMQEHAPKLTPQGNLFEGKPQIQEIGNIKQGEAISDLVYEQNYSTEVQHHNPLEPHCSVASWQNDELTLWDSNQGIHAVRDALSRSLGLPLNKIRVVNHHVGGGFGSKNGLRPHHVIAAILSQKTGRPVKISANRKDEFIASRHRAKTKRFIRAGVKRDGTLTFIYQRAVGQAGPDQMFADIAAHADASIRIYRCPNLKTEMYQVLTNTQNPVVFRGPTVAEDVFCFEQFIDELAHELKVDPLEFRLKNYADEDQVDHQPYTSKGLRDCYEKGAQVFGWKWQTPGSRAAGSKRRGVGMGSTILGGDNYEQSQAVVILQPDGTARVFAGVSDIGCGIDTIFAQIAAEELGLKAESVSVHYGDSREHPYTINSSYGSRTTAIAGPTVRAAASDARRQLLELASRELKVAPEGLSIVDEQVVVKGDPARRTPLKEIAKKMGRELMIGVGKRHKGVDKMAIGIFGAHFVEVEVDVETGQVRVLRAVCAHDSGRWINPLLAESQIQGGFIQGMGMALYEERIMDTRLGRMLNDSMLQYLTPTILDTPEQITAIEIPIVDPGNSINAKGLGEPPLVGAGAAIANAIFNATGVRVREYPITPNKILTALKDAASVKTHCV